MSAAAELLAWRTGTAHGGPNADGRYPLTNSLGVVSLLLCPAADQAALDGLGNEPETYAAAAMAARDESVAAKVLAQAAATAAALSKTGAASSATGASASAIAAASSAEDAADSLDTVDQQLVVVAAQVTAAGNAASAAYDAQVAAVAAKTSSETARDSASASAGVASTKATAADSSATAAAGSATTAGTANTNAQAAKTAALAAQTAAETAKTAAAGSATVAGTKETAATASATAAAGSAATAVTKAGEASVSATGAASAKTSAETARDLAYSWADAPIDTAVAGGDYSAFHWAQKAMAAASGLLTYKGVWSASTGAFPAAPKKGDFWKVSGAGVVGGNDLNNGDQIFYDGSAWAVIDNTDKVSSVNGKIGSVVLAPSDVGALPAGGTITFTGPVAAGAATFDAAGNATVPLNGFVDPSYISGCIPTWLSATSIKISQGAAYLPGKGAVFAVPADVTLCAITGTGWKYVYLSWNGGAPTFVVSTTAPVAGFPGTFVKTGDDTQRFVFAVYVNAAVGIYKFAWDACRVLSMEKVGNKRVISGGTSASPYGMSMLTVVPGIVARLIVVNALNTAATGTLTVDTNDMNYTLGSASFITVPAGGVNAFDIPYPSTNNLVYSYQSGAPGTGCYIDVMGYTYSR